MRVIAVSTLKAFWATRPEYLDAEAPPLAWYREVVKADWTTPNDVKRQFRTASILRNVMDGSCSTLLATNIVSSCGSITRTRCSMYASSAPTRSTTASMHRPVEERLRDILPIKAKADYRATLHEIETLMAATPGTFEGDRLDVLVTLVEAYERRHFPMDLPDVVDAIKFRMEQQGLTVDDLVPAIGRKNRVYEILARRRPLTLRMIQTLSAELKIPAESLLHQSAERRAG